MKCLIKVGLYAASFASTVFTIALPMLGDVLARYGPDVFTFTNSDGVRFLTQGTAFSLILLGFTTLMSAIVGFCVASDIKCD